MKSNNKDAQICNWIHGLGDNYLQNGFKSNPYLWFSFDLRNNIYKFMGVPPPPDHNFDVCLIVH